MIVDVEVHAQPSSELSLRLERMGQVVSDNQMDRITGVVRNYIDVNLMVKLLNNDGWAAVVAALPCRAKLNLAALVTELEGEMHLG